MFGIEFALCTVFFVQHVSCSLSRPNGGGVIFRGSRQPQSFDNAHYLAPSMRGDACRWHAFIADRIEDETWLRKLTPTLGSLHEGAGCEAD